MKSVSGLMNKKVILIIVLVLAIVLAYSYMSNKDNNKTLKPSAENLINETIKYNVKEIKADYLEISEISKKYSLDDAILDKCYVYIEGREYNKEVFDSFISNVDEGQKSKARVVKGNDASGVIINPINIPTKAPINIPILLGSILEKLIALITGDKAVANIIDTMISLKSILL